MFLKPNDPSLTKISKEIPDSQISSKETQEIVKLMLKIAYGQQKEKDKPVMVGLAAPQIGILKRIILVDVKANGKGKIGDLRVYINPEITWSSQEKGEWYEGCYSTGRVCGIVTRPISIKIKALKLTVPHPVWNIKKVEEEFSGYVARIFQHEIDHLNGKRFPDLITDPDKLHWVKKSEFPLYRNRGAWRNWPKKAKFPLLKRA